MMRDNYTQKELDQMQEKAEQVFYLIATAIVLTLFVWFVR